MDLAPQHRDLLTDSAISDEVAESRGYWTATRRSELERLGFKRAQQNVPALVIPIRDSRGRIVTYQVRPDQPRISDTGRAIKYETPGDTVPALDVPPGAREGLSHPVAPLWITEGARKADSMVSAGQCCVSLPGVWSWAKRLNGDARQVLPDLQRVAFAGRKVIVAFDSDAMVKPQVYAALEALSSYLQSQEALVHYCYLPELEPGFKCGLDDYLAAGNTIEQLWEYVEDELRPKPEPQENRKPALPTAKLLGYIDNLLTRYVHFPGGGEHERVALALFVLHTWSIESADVTPYLYVKSPQKQSGKTRLLEVLGLACRDARRTSSITEAAIYQAVEAWRPTLLIDEVDAVFGGRSERTDALRGILDAGNARGDSAIRGTQEMEPREFGTFCPKVLAGIDTGKLPDTIRDRSIVIALERKRHDEPVGRLRRRKIAADIDELETRLADWAAEHAEELSDYECELIPGISDRLEDGWEPLLAIAELASGDWPQRARDAAVALAAGAEDAAEDHGQLLLAALQDIFEGREAITTNEICIELNGDEELPFGAYRKGDGIDGRGLANRLRPHGIRPTTLRIDGKTPKGYRRAQLLEAWARYTAESVRAQAAAVDPQQPQQRNSGAGDGSTEPDAHVAAGETLAATQPQHAQTALESQIEDECCGVADVADEVQPAARTHISGCASHPGDPRPGCRYCQGGPF